jgi:hypothetical protein
MTKSVFGGSIGLVLMLLASVPGCAASSGDEEHASSAASALTSVGSTFVGTTYVTFFNGRNISSIANVELPLCPGTWSVIVQPQLNSIACSSAENAQALGVCPHAGSTSQLLSASTMDTNPFGFRAFLETLDGVCVGLLGSDPLGSTCGAISPNYPVTYFAACGS